MKNSEIDRDRLEGKYTLHQLKRDVKELADYPEENIELEKVRFFQCVDDFKAHCRKASTNHSKLKYSLLRIQNELKYNDKYLEYFQAIITQ